MNTDTEIKKCKCGYHIIVYSIRYNVETKKEPRFHFFDGHSGNYEQTYVCPGCNGRLDYMTLEG